MSSSRTLSRKFRTFFTCIKPRFDPSIILLYIAASVEQYCDITQVNALPQNEGILEPDIVFRIFHVLFTPLLTPPSRATAFIGNISRIGSVYRKDIAVKRQAAGGV